MEENRERVYENPWLTITRQQHRLSSGQTVDYYVKEEADVVVCVPVTTDGSLVVVEEYRPGPAKVLTEVPGGNMEPGEDPVAAAAREIREETGYTGNPVHLATTYMSAYSTAKKHIFVMPDARNTGAAAPDAQEDIRVRILSPDAFEANAMAGNLTDLDAALLVINYLKQG